MRAPSIGLVPALSCPMAIDGAEITSDVLATRPKLFSAAEAVRGALNLAADLLLTPVCISCRKRAGAHGLLCGDCWAKIDFIVPPLCSRLGVPLPYDTGEASLSAGAIADPPVYDRARASARYSSTMRDLIQSFKYGVAMRACLCSGDGWRRPAP